MRRYFLGAFVVLPLFLRGQDTGQTQKRTVTATVINGLTGEPIRRALVTLFEAGVNGRCLTDAGGRCQIEKVPDGSTQAMVQKPGYFEGNSNSGARSHTVFTVSAAKTDVALQLYPGGKITGRVLDSDGDPIEGVQIQVLVQQIAEGRRTWTGRNASSTDDDGSYSIEELTPGRYLVFVGAHMLPDAQDGRPEIAGPAFYPDARDIATAQNIGLAAGQEFRADFHLRPQVGYRVAGTVTGYRQDRGIGIWMETPSGQQVGLANLSFDQNKATFEALAVPPGNWMLVVNSSDGQGQPLQITQPISVTGSDVPNVQILMHPNAYIPVAVNRPVKTDTAVSEPVPSDQGDPFNASLLPMDDRGQPSAMSRNAEGVRQFANVSEGRYRLSIQTYGDECLEAAWYGNVDVMRDSIVVGADGPAQTVTLDLTKDCASLSLHTDAPDGGAAVVISNSYSIAPIQLPLPPNRLGSMRILPIALSPGTYTVYAFSDLTNVEYANPDVLREYSGQTVDLTAGQKADLTVTVNSVKEN